MCQNFCFRLSTAKCFNYPNFRKFIWLRSENKITIFRLLQQFQGLAGLASGYSEFLKSSPSYPEAGINPGKIS
jgi:hypothetical protein